MSNFKLIDKSRYSRWLSTYQSWLYAYAEKSAK